jgi:hypothetical protein
VFETGFSDLQQYSDNTVANINMEYLCFMCSCAAEQGISWTEFAQLIRVIVALSITAKNMSDLPIFPCDTSSKNQVDFCFFTVLLRSAV